MMKIILIFVILLSLTGFNQAEPVKVVIMYTNNTNGVLENCHCPSHPYGALEKRAVIIERVRKREKNVLLLDTGDISDIAMNTLRHTYVLKAYQYMKYDAWTAGDQDFVEGMDFFRENYLSLDMSLVNINITYKDQLLGDKYIIKQFDNIKIGITGIIDSDFQKYIYSDAKKYIKIIDQDNALTNVLSELKDQCDYIILLSHSGIDRDHSIAGQHPGINLIIGGHSQTLTKVPEKVNDTYIVQAGENGFRIGTLSLIFENKKCSSINNQVLLLKENAPDQPEIMKLIEEYKKKLKEKK